MPARLYRGVSKHTSPCIICGFNELGNGSLRLAVLCHLLWHLFNNVITQTPLHQMQDKPALVSYALFYSRMINQNFVITISIIKKKIYVYGSVCRDRLAQMVEPSLRKIHHFYAGGDLRSIQRSGFSDAEIYQFKN